MSTHDGPESTIITRAEVLGHLPDAGQRVGADSGDPQVGARALAGTEPGLVGVWECQRGGWPITRRTDTEACYILSGRARITDAATGVVRTITAGDLLLLPRGWSGRWDVEETIRKVYAIF